MQSRFTTTALALLIGLACAAAHAQSKTREQVCQELADAVRDGSLMRGEVEARGAMPSAMMNGRTRSEVQAELAAAQRSGDMLAAGEAGQRANELYPSRDAQQPMFAGKTRAQVLAELAEAQRNGDLLAAGESSLTQRELHPGLYPRAAAPMLASAPGSAAMRASDRTLH